ncbi:MAG: hypothetical protein K2X32_10560, partial [Phycisphaerales bacterium]|nr:hypothetical protein [Phycisphaerales bacterium]
DARNGSNAPQPPYAVADSDRDEKLYYVQNWRADVVALLNQDGRPVEHVRYTAYGAPRRFLTSPIDIAYDTGDALPPKGPPINTPNNGVQDGDYNLFFAKFFGSLPEADVANDAGAPLPPFGPQGANNGVNEGDYNFLFSVFFDGWDNGEANAVSSASIGNTIGYAGYEYDPILITPTAVSATPGTGSAAYYHVRHRVYDANLGRWTRRDPLGYHDGMGLYEYVMSVPLIASDPRGLAAAGCGASCQVSEPATSPTLPGMTPPAPSKLACVSPDVVLPPNIREPGSFDSPTRKRCLTYCLEGGLGRMFCEDGKPFICICPANIKKRFPDGGDDFRTSYRACVEAHERTNWNHHTCDPKNPNADPIEKPGHGKAACNEAEAYRIEALCAAKIKCTTTDCAKARESAVSEASCLQELWMRACRGGAAPTVEEGNACRNQK